ncbi:MAG TPA: hypothetical protein VNJ07_09325 [Chitinophagales bacterium]|nr:hypothetical protein [Chitinophagales bacterium]
MNFPVIVNNLVQEGLRHCIQSTEVLLVVVRGIEPRSFERAADTKICSYGSNINASI